VELELVRY